MEAVLEFIGYNILFSVVLCFGVIIVLRLLSVIVKDKNE